jgi:outer membrane protein TolC
MLALLLALQGVVSPPADSLPRVTLTEALQRAARLDPNYVSALGQVDNAVWARRNAFAVFILPSVTLNADLARPNPRSVNFITFQPVRNQVTAQLTARYDLFTGGQKFAELTRSAAALEGAHAGELAARFATALSIESDYYAVLADRELTRVAQDRLRRAQQGVSVARARVQSGAAVQTDSLQFLLERNRAQVGALQQEARLKASRLQLGRRVGEAGPVDAVPLDTILMPELPVPLAEAIAQAAEQGPQYRIARANERVARASYRSRLGSYLPRLSLSFNALAFDTTFFPKGFKRTTFTLSASFPLWDNGQRELALSQARVSRDVARAVREDMDRAVLHDVTAAYDAYVTARASYVLAVEGLAVARENYRVQDTRYRAGATTILDLLDAQLGLSQAEADLVTARYGTRLALAGLEAILGRRLFTDKETP